MNRIARRAFAALIAIGLAAPAIVIAADRSADAIVKEIEAIKPPKTYAEFQEGNKKKAELIGELAKAHPDDARLEALLPKRWSALANDGQGKRAIEEIDAKLAKAGDDKKKADFLFSKVRVLLADRGTGAGKAGPAIDEFLKLAPKDPRGASLLYATVQLPGGESRKTEVEARIVKDYPDSQYAALIRGERRQRESIGKPFELEFTDAIKGETVSIKGLKGKVVVIDFWATWCGPCVAEMPTMKKLYAEYKGKGVEFIGVSLDEPKEAGGLDKLKKFVADKEIAWPQYYQGKGWEGEFSKSWGIDGIPCVFVIDADGKLHSTDARGKLGTLIPELLSRRDKTSAGGGR